MAEPRVITEMAERVTKLFHQNGSEWFLQCAVQLMCVDFEPDVVAEKLEALAKHIREHQ